MKKIFFVITISLLIFSKIVSAQLIFSNNDFENFEYDIKQIDEFILRFNLEELLIMPDQSSQFERDNRILLFDKQYYLENQMFLNHFLDSIETQKTMISFYDSTWYAVAECNVTFQGKKDKLTLILRTEQVKDDIYKWSIVDAQGTILDLNPKSKSDRLRLLPTDNEVNFIALQSVTTTNSPNITLYNEKTHANDRLSVFNSLVYYKLLKVDNVQELSYCFTQVNGYVFFVKKFTRDEKNTGWLIYDVQQKKVEEGNNSCEDNTIIAQKNISQFYNMLSDYAKVPNNITLARAIQALFYTPKKSFFFGAKHIYNDLDIYFFKHYSPYAYVAISDYLNSLANITISGVVLSYKVSEFQLLSSDGNTINVSYLLKISNKEDIIGEYYTTATTQDGLIVNIVPLNEIELK